jgi:hypothetical protein
VPDTICALDAVSQVVAESAVMAGDMKSFPVGMSGVFMKVYVGEIDSN